MKNRAVQKYLETVRFQCGCCGWLRLQRKHAVYVEHVFQRGNPKPYVEIPPVCQDCASKIGTGMFDAWRLRQQ